LKRVITKERERKGREEVLRERRGKTDSKRERVERERKNEDELKGNGAGREGKKERWGWESEGKQERREDGGNRGKKR
jgi:hypothetical protein